MLELPSEALIETEDSDLQAACLAFIVDSPGPTSYNGSVVATDTSGQLATDDEPDEDAAD